MVGVVEAADGFVRVVCAKAHSDSRQTAAIATHMPCRMFKRRPRSCRFAKEEVVLSLIDAPGQLTCSCAINGRGINGKRKSQTVQPRWLCIARNHLCSIWSKFSYTSKDPRAMQI